jgi:NADH-quinone oxidoreductase subunit N
MSAVTSILPEITLIVAAVAIYMGGAFVATRSVWRWIAGGAVLLAAGVLWRQHNLPGLEPPFCFDHLALFGRWLVLGMGFALLGMRRGDTEPECVGSLLLTVAGGMLVAAAGNLVLLFVALELVSIPTYVLLYLGRRDAASQESAAKYFFLSVLASAVLLYGMSFLYGATGSIELTSPKTASGLAPLARIAMVMIFAGLCFKIAAVPFHFYAPDVYQGATHSNAALLSTVPKAAGLLAMLRILIVAAPGLEPYAWKIVLAVSVLTMTFGNVLALWQDDLRRLLAYSSIAQSGYMLMALAVALAGGAGATAWDGVASLGFYLVVYAAATIGAFAVLQHLGREDRTDHRGQAGKPVLLEHLGRTDRSLDGVDELAGLGATRPGAAAVLTVCLLSLTGVPPLAGFWGKLMVFGSALSVEPAAGAGAEMRWWFAVAAVIGVLNAAVAAAYYLRLAAVMYFRTPLATPRAEGGRGAWWAAVACAAAVVALGIYPGVLAGTPKVERNDEKQSVDGQPVIGYVQSASHRAAMASTAQGKHTTFITKTHTVRSSQNGSLMWPDRSFIAEATTIGPSRWQQSMA